MKVTSSIAFGIEQVHMRHILSSVKKALFLCSGVKVVRHHKMLTMCLVYELPLLTLKFCDYLWRCHIADEAWAYFFLPSHNFHVFLDLGINELNV